ncbi:MAG: FAD:protein FMN transferase [Planctomycetaceae bacterium]|nr:FAD:protein FMN transferase [Planctomycetaceae bacterium]
MKRKLFEIRMIALALILGGSVLCLGWGCQKQKPSDEIQLRGQTMGTFYQVTLASSEKCNQPEELKQHVEDLLEQINLQMSTYLPDSEISKFNDSQSTDWFEVSSDFANVAFESLEIAQQTGGAFDPTIGPLVNLWHFGPDQSTQSLPSEKTIEQAREVVGYQKLHVRLDPPAIKKEIPQLHLDLSAIAKGYAVDQVAHLVAKQGYKNYLVNIGGEVVAHGEKNSQFPWRLGIEKPLEDRREIAELVALQNTAMATSGDYRNFYEIDGQKFSHTIDSKTGRPVTHTLRSVSVIAATCSQADAFATALMVLGPQRAWAFAKEHQLNIYLIYEQDGKLTEQHSAKFPIDATKD